MNELTREDYDQFFQLAARIVLAQVAKTKKYSPVVRLTNVNTGGQISFTLAFPPHERTVAETKESLSLAKTIHDEHRARKRSRMTKWVDWLKRHAGSTT